MEIIRVLIIAVGIIGIAVIVWGALLCFIKLLRLEYRAFKGDNICSLREALRHHFGSYILLGLEFLIAADIVRTVVNPDFEGLIILGAIVLIRTVISYFLNRELTNLHNCG
jgi:uncharacterized membrane protein